MYDLYCYVSIINTNNTGNDPKPMKIAVGEERNERDSAPILALSRKTSKWARNYMLSNNNLNKSINRFK